jgi:hypothetical protein
LFYFSFSLFTEEFEYWSDVSVVFVCVSTVDEEVAVDVDWTDELFASGSFICSSSRTSISTVIYIFVNKIMNFTFMCYWIRSETMTVDL